MIGSAARVAVTITSASRTASSARAPPPRRPAMPARASRLQTTTRSKSRTARIASRCDAPWMPAPRIASIFASSRASSRVATPETAAVRIAVIAPAFMTARGLAGLAVEERDEPLMRVEARARCSPGRSQPPSARRAAPSPPRCAGIRPIRLGSSGRPHDETQRVVHLAARERRERVGHHVDALAIGSSRLTSCCRGCAPRHGKKPSDLVSFGSGVRSQAARGEHGVEVRGRASGRRRLRHPGAEHPGEGERRHVDTARARPPRRAARARRRRASSRAARTARDAGSSATRPGTPRRAGTCRSASRRRAARTARTRCRARRRAGSRRSSSPRSSSEYEFWTSAGAPGRSASRMPSAS